MKRSRTNNSIIDQATFWAVELAHGDMGAQARGELDAWLAADDRHRGALLRARAWLIASEDALANAHDTHQPAPAQAAVGIGSNDNEFDDNHCSAPGQGLDEPRNWGRRLLLTTGAIAAAACAVFWLGPALTLSTSAPTDNLTHVVRLQDGSLVTLDKGARVQAIFSPHFRRITLVNGKATFDVAEDADRPFVVHTGRIYAQATGTIYSVEPVGATGGRVAVTEGGVLVWPNDERDQAVLLRAGGALTLDPGPAARASADATANPRPLPKPELAQISLDNVRVADAVLRFNRLNSRKIIVEDPAIAALEIVGLYRADEPEQFAAAVAEITGGVVDTTEQRIVIKKK